MAISIQRVPDGEDVWGRFRVRFLDVTLDTSYPNTGGTVGYLVNATDLGFKSIFDVEVVGQNTASLAWTYFFDINASISSATVSGNPATLFNLKAFVITTGVQVANGVDLSTATLRLCIIGR